MLIREILGGGDVSKGITDDLMDFISAYRQDGIDAVPMSGPGGAVTYLRRLGYSVDAGGIIDVVTQEPFLDVVERADPASITLKSSEPQPGVSPDEQEKSQEKVDKNAAKVATQAVKTGGEL